MNCVADDPWPAAVSAVVAVCALGLTCWAQWRQRVHNRLSVKPHLQGIINSSRIQPVLGVLVENTGLGAAEIIEFRVYVDDMAVQATDSATYMAELYRLEIGGEKSYLESGIGITAGTTRRLFTYDPRADDTVADDAERQWNLGRSMRSLYRLRFEIEYQSMYGERLPPLVIDLTKNSPPDWVAQLPTVAPPSVIERARRSGRP